jgi:CBS-domain-containing membrane protein
VISLGDVDGLTAADLVHRRLSTLPASTTIGELRAYFSESSGRKLAVLVDGDRYAGSIAADALPEDADDDAPAAAYAQPGDVVAAAAPASAARDAALEHPTARLPVVGDAGVLIGVVAINSARDGFCGT